MREIGPKIPGGALLLGLAGLIPFLWGVLVVQTGQFAFIADPRVAVLAYGLMIFCFMAGSLWGFAASAEWETGYFLAVAPVIFFIAFVALGMPVNFVLILGFLALLPLDWLFQKFGHTPRWWLKLRIGLTVVVVACLIALVRT
ncbi:uncharacterized protein DUF3429 [Thioclava sp. ES.031]|uniref:DUF3429 domain-containing protein n=1 Tax=unclassified Thioclava TaxID=2621713 RepID=UPI000997A0BF|nr:MULTISPECIES: DUF3429 domain-containing protein [unclassified Thioclava]OOY09245.1 hypothetical protein BMI89_09905 [Thioclava sp. F36-7]OOY14548.1 hypothetical protein BMI85_17980 [Thioclava sp. DLFJ4-1]PFG61704.1 uncharacterized protein DUF3429 [Thioclava sp. ES.031]